ncbi:MAG: hypothetical protein WBB29_09280 [Geitlerinemataceae cyanobacterium]
MPHNPEGLEYTQRLYPWALARLLPDTEKSVVGRFRTRSEAEGRLSCLIRLTPKARFVVFFDSKL